MIFGTGIDISATERFEKWVDNNKFCSKYFSEDELSYVKSRGRGAAQSLAAGFAAKEALAKALGTGFVGFPLKDITVLRDLRGKPYFSLEGTVAQMVQGCGENVRIHLSLSHEKNLAVAQVIIEVDNV